jgi:hypothetical protein
MPALSSADLMISSIFMFLSLEKNPTNFGHDRQMDLNLFVSTGNFTPSIGRE